jgi:hypothetical protein
MTKKNANRAPFQAHGSHRAYSPEILPQMQSLLAALADIDCAYDIDVETVRNSTVPGVIKQGVLATLQQRHQERRAPYIRQLEALQHRMLMAA